MSLWDSSVKWFRVIRKKSGEQIQQGSRSEAQNQADQGEWHYMAWQKDMAIMQRASDNGPAHILRDWWDNEPQLWRWVETFRWSWWVECMGWLGGGIWNHRRASNETRLTSAPDVQWIKSFVWLKYIVENLYKFQKCRWKSNLNICQTNSEAWSARPSWYWFLWFGNWWKHLGECVNTTQQHTEQKLRCI